MIIYDHSEGWLTIEHMGFIDAIHQSTNMSDYFRHRKNYKIGYEEGLKYLEENKDNHTEVVFVLDLDHLTKMIDLTVGDCIEIKKGANVFHSKGRYISKRKTKVIIENFRSGYCANIDNKGVFHRPIDAQVEWVADMLPRLKSWGSHFKAFLNMFKVFKHPAESWGDVRFANVYS